MSLLEKFSDRCIPEPNSGCWLWFGAGVPNGYGYFNVRGHGKAPTPAHRLSWQLFRGPIPEGQCVCHKCDVRCCVNPEHLFLGTATDNMQDAAKKGRMNWKPHHKRELRRGIKHPQAKLTEDQVMAIRASSDLGIDLARQFGITPVTVSRIKRKIIWKHVGG